MLSTDRESSPSCASSTHTFYSTVAQVLQSPVSRLELVEAVGMLVVEYAQASLSVTEVERQGGDSFVLRKRTAQCASGIRHIWASYLEDMCQTPNEAEVHLRVVRQVHVLVDALEETLAVHERDARAG